MPSVWRRHGVHRREDAVRHDGRSASVWRRRDA
jgi:hypothetical protein